MKNKSISKFYDNVKNKNNSIYKKSILVGIFNKILFCFIIFISCLILIKVNPSFKEFIDKNIYKDNISFAYLNNLYNKYFGKILPSYQTESTEEVISEKLIYSNYTNYENGYLLDVSEKYAIPVITSGIVVYIGEMDKYGSVVIIDGIDDVNIWYGNVTNLNVNLYDYVSNDSYLGEVINDELYLVFEKNQEYLTFEDYIL